VNFETTKYYFDFNYYKTFQFSAECLRNRNMNVDSALSWPMVSRKCLAAPEDTAGSIQPQRASKKMGADSFGNRS
jgi:hypothetical protein